MNKAILLALLVGAMATIGMASAIPVCGDGACNGGETRITCVEDCAVCGDSFCDDPPEGPYHCPSDCRECGDDKCTPGEDSGNCPEDCGYGDGTGGKNYYSSRHQFTKFVANKIIRSYNYWEAFAEKNCIKYARNTGPQTYRALASKFPDACELGAIVTKMKSKNSLSSWQLVFQRTIRQVKTNGGRDWVEAS